MRRRSRSKNGIMKLLKLSHRVNRKSISALALSALIAFPSSSFAYSCTGAVAHLGIDAEGRVYVSLANSAVASSSTAIHSICSVVAQGSFAMPVPVCKAAYASLVSARVTGKSIILYYNDSAFVCNSIPNWGQMPSAYYVEGPYPN